jgi:hypothetical protein
MMASQGMCICLATAAMALAGHASPTPAPSPTPPFKLAISPAGAIIKDSAIRQVSISNEGSKPLHIRASVTSLTRLHGRCVVARSDVSDWSHVSPARFNLAPGATHKATVRVEVPLSARGKRDLLVMFSSTAPRKTKTPVRIVGSVAQIVEVSLPGKSPSALCVALAVPKRPASLSPWLVLTGALCCALALAGALWALLRLRRRGQHAHRLA